MTHSAGSVTTHRIAFKHVMASEPYRFQKKVMASFPYIKVYCFGVLLKFSSIHNKFLGSFAKNRICHQNKILQYLFSKSVHGYLTMRCVT
jgi:hypothetical protein